MKAFVILIRGINVGGKNMIAMASLKTCLEDLGYTHVTTYIASGNVLLTTDEYPNNIKDRIEEALPKCFTLDSKLIKVLVLSLSQLQAIVDTKPNDFGDHPDMYHSDVIFLMGIDMQQALSVFKPKEGVDTIWPGDSVIYSQRLSALRTKSHLSKIVGTLPYQSMTIRTWGTTTKLLALLKKLQEQ